MKDIQLKENQEKIRILEQLRQDNIVLLQERDKEIEELKEKNKTLLLKILEHEKEEEKIPETDSLPTTLKQNSLYIAFNVILYLQRRKKNKLYKEKIASLTEFIEKYKQLLSVKDNQIQQLVVKIGEIFQQTKEKTKEINSVQVENANLRKEVLFLVLFQSFIRSID